MIRVYRSCATYDTQKRGVKEDLCRKFRVIVLLMHRERTSVNAYHRRHTYRAASHNEESKYRHMGRFSRGTGTRTKHPYPHPCAGNE